MDAAPELTNPERALLITQIINSIGGTRLVNAAGWAALWFADIEILRSCAQCDTMQNWIIAELLSIDNKNFPRLLLDWRGVPISEEMNALHEEGTRKRRMFTMELVRTSGMIVQASAEEDSLWPPTMSNALPSSGNRGENAMQIASDRDMKCCVTEAREPLEVAHIFPYNLRHREEPLQYHFWMRLSMFWPKERVEASARAVYGPDATETPTNPLTLSPTVHKLWGLSGFALKPVELSWDTKTFCVQFFWLPINPFGKDRKYVAITDIPSWVNHHDASPLGCKLFNCLTEQVICSGDVITMRTEDPISHPLPSWDLLDMQWVLHRVVALSGAAEASEEDLDSDDESSLEDGEWEKENMVLSEEDHVRLQCAGLKLC